MKNSKSIKEIIGAIIGGLVLCCILIFVVNIFCQSAGELIDIVIEEAKKTELTIKVVVENEETQENSTTMSLTLKDDISTYSLESYKK